MSLRGQHIAGLEQTIIDQAHHINAVEAEMSLRGQHIAGLEQTIIDQAHHIDTIEAVLMRFRHSFYGKCFSGLSRLYSLLGNKKTLS